MMLTLDQIVALTEIWNKGTFSKLTEMMCELFELEVKKTTPQFQNVNKHTNGAWKLFLRVDRLLRLPMGYGNKWQKLEMVAKSTSVAQSYISRLADLKKEAY